MQSVRSRIWTRVAVSISCEDNHYTTGTSFVIAKGAYAVSRILYRQWFLILDLSSLASMLLIFAPFKDFNIRDKITPVDAEVGVVAAFMEPLEES